MSDEIRIVLASASPARLALLRAAGVDPLVIASGVRETDVAGTAEEVSLILAERKASSVALELKHHLEGPAIIVAADSVLEFNDQIHGRPADADAARALWRQMRGSTGVLHTGHCVIDTATNRTLSESAQTTVHFADLSDEEIDMYVATGEPLRVAGAFTLDGLGAPFVQRIEGDPKNVIGLSLPLLRRMLAELGITWTDLWRPWLGSGTDR